MLSQQCRWTYEIMKKPKQASSVMFLAFWKAERDSENRLRLVLLLNQVIVQVQTHKRRILEKK